MRQLADFVGDYRKTSPGLTRTRRFDSSIECKQVSLLGNSVNYIELKE